MSTSVVHLTSDCFPSNVLNEMHRLRCLEQLCDVTIRVEHQGVLEEFKAHKILLAASSKYFQELFLCEKAENGSAAPIVLQEMPTADIECFLNFIYTATVNVSEDRIERMLQVATTLGSPDLLEACKQVDKRAERTASPESFDSCKSELERSQQDLHFQATEDMQGGQVESIGPSDGHGKSDNLDKKAKQMEKGEQRKESSRLIQGKMRRSSTRLAGRKVFVDIPKKKYIRKLREQFNSAAQLSEQNSSVNTILLPKVEEGEKPHSEERIQEVGSEQELLGSDHAAAEVGRDVVEEFFDVEFDMDDDPAKDLENADRKKKGGAFRCDACQRDFQYEKSYLKHIQHSHGIMPEIIYRCDTCNQTFANRCNLKSHERHVHSNERLFPCEICGKKFKRRKDVKRHVLQVHEGGSERHICPVCGKGLSSKTALKLHERTHTGDKPYECTDCEAKFTQPSALKTHQRIHTGEKPFVCSECGAKFTQNHMLIYHKRCHTGEKPFMCENCGKSFASKEYLKHHSRIHTGSKPFKCDICSRMFAQRNSLHQHIKVHTGERPYCCDQCGKQFTQLNALQRHHRIHTGEKPYMCRLCLRTFTDKSTLRRHTLIHDKETPWKSFLVILDGACKKEPKTRMKQGDEPNLLKIPEEERTTTQNEAEQNSDPQGECKTGSQNGQDWGLGGQTAITLVNPSSSLAPALSTFAVIHPETSHQHLQAVVNMQHLGEHGAHLVTVNNQVSITVPVCISLTSQINNILTQTSAGGQSACSVAVAIPQDDPQVSVVDGGSQNVENTAEGIGCLPPEGV